MPVTRTWARVAPVANVAARVTRLPELIRELRAAERRVDADHDRQQAGERMRAILSTATAENRELTTAENAELEQLDASLTASRAPIDRLRAAIDEELGV